MWVKSLGAAGFGELSVRALARAAGVSPGTVQHHFPTSRGVPTDPADLAATSEDLLRLRLAAAMTRPGLSAAILFDRSDDHEARLAYLAEALRPSRLEALERLRALTQAGVLRARDPVMIAVLFGILLPTLSSAGPALKALFDLDLNDAAVQERLVTGLADVLSLGLLPDIGRTGSTTGSRDSPRFSRPGSG